MDNRNNKDNRNSKNLGIYSGVLASLGAQTATMGYLSSQGLKAKGEEFERQSKHQSYINYLQNRLMDLHLEKDKNNEQEINKINGELENFKPKWDLGMTKNIYYEPSNTSEIKLDPHYLSESEKEHKKLLKGIGSLRTKAEIVTKGGIAVTGLGALGMAYSELHNRKGLEKKSYDNSNNNENNNDALNEMLTDKRSYLAPAGMAMLGSGALLGHVANKTTELNKQNEKKYKFHFNESSINSKKLEGVAEQIKNLEDENKTISDARKKKINEKLIGSLGEEKLNLTAKRNEHYLKAMSNLVGIGKNPAPYLSQTASTLKWGSVPMLGVGGYYMLHKNRDNKTKMTEKDNKTYNNISTGLVAGGILATLGGMYRPFMKGTAISSKKLMGGVEDIEKANSKGIDENTIEEAKNLRTENDIDNFKEKLKDTADKGKDLMNNFPYKRDVQVAALGQGMMSAGGLGMFLTANPEEIKEKQEELNHRKLLKQSFFPGLFSGVISHVGQNMVAKTKIHGGESSQRFANYLKEGNTGKTNLNPLQSFFRGVERGTVNVDDSIVASEAKKLGKNLKENGTDLEDLNYFDKKFIEHYGKGEFDKALIHAPYSNVAHNYLIGDPKYQALFGKVPLNNAIRKLSKQDLKEIQEKYGKTSLRNFMSGMSGKAEGEYNSNTSPIGNKTFNVLGKAYNKVKSALHLNPSNEFKYNAKVGNFAAKAGQAAGIAGSTLADPALGAINILKPALFSGKIGEKTNIPADYFLKATFARGLSGMKPNSNKATGLLSEFAASPAFNQLETLYHNKGAMLREILKRGLSKEEFEDVMNRQGLKETLANPYFQVKNAIVDGKISAHGLKNLDESILNSSPNVSSDLRDRSQKIIDEGLKNKQVEQSDINNLARDTISEQANKMSGKIAGKAVSSNLNEAEKVKKGRDKYDSYLNKLMLPAVAGGTGLFLAPQVISDYKKHKKEKQLHKHSSASDNNDNSEYAANVATGALGGIGMGGYLNFVHKKNSEANINSLSSILSGLKEEDPVKASTMLEEIKKDKSYSSFVKTKEFKDVENKLKQHKEKYIEHAMNSEPAKKLLKMKDKFEKERLPIDVDKPRNFTGMTWDVLRFGTSVAKNGNEKYAKKHAGEAEKAWLESQQLKDQMIEHNKKYNKIFHDDFKNGGMKDSLNALEKRLYKDVKVPNSVKLKNLGGGAILGALAGYGAHKVMDISNQRTYSKNDPAHNTKSDIFTPTIVGAGLGGLAGVKAAQAFKKFRTGYLDNVLGSKVVSPNEKILSASMWNVGNDVGDEALKMKANHGVRDIKDYQPDFKELNRLSNKNAHKLSADDIKTITPLALVGGLVGAQVGMQNDINKKDKERLYKSSAYSQQDSDNTDKMYYAAPLALGVGGGALQGYFKGKDEKTSKELFRDEFKKGINEFSKISDDDFGKDISHTEGILQLTRDLKSLGFKKELQNNKHYAELKKHQDNYQDLLLKNDPYERASTNDLENIVQTRKKYRNFINSNSYIKNNPKVRNQVIEQMNKAIKRISTPDAVAEKHMNNVLALNDEFDHMRSSSKLLRKDLSKYEPLVDKKFNSIVRGSALKGGLIGGTLGALGSAAIYHDLNKKD